jgi:hypothetical protein
MPLGIKRRRIIAAKSSAISPNVDPAMKEKTPLIPPSRIEPAVVPARMAAPPEITVMKAFAI